MIFMRNSVLAGSVTAVLLTLVTCRPSSENAQFTCDPAAPEPCPSGMSCLVWGDDHYCFSGDTDGVCGDGTLDPGEECDDGNTSGLDSCTGECVRERCGNGILEESAGEKCDDGNRAAGDGCSPWCVNEYCGDGVVAYDSGEQCDDGGFLSRDGCSSGCDTELPFWKLWQPRLGGGVQHPTMAYDSGRAVTVWFGGSSRGKTLSETWEYDGTRWRKVSTVVSPPPRRAAEMIYDEHREKIVLYGGWDPNASPPYVYSDTWEFNGTTWVDVTGGVRPPPVVTFCFAYDSARQVAVLYGGREAVRENPGWTVSEWGMSDEIWEYDGSVWVDKSNPLGGSPPYSGVSCAYDRQSQRIVYFVGGDFGSTWEYDGESWEAVGAYPGLTNSDFRAVYDSAREQVLSVGGTRLLTGAPTYAFDSDTGTWSVVTQSPTPRRWAAHQAVYDTARERVVVFGGTAILPVETWELVDASWVDVSAPIGPEPRDGYGLAHDVHRGVTVMFGGIGDGTTFADTWEYDGDTWIEGNPTASPIVRRLPAMAYDPWREETVLFGGTVNVGGRYGEFLFGDTWTWNGTEWTIHHPANSPSSRSRSCMAADPQSGFLLLFGGSADSDGMADTWAWNGTNWAEYTVPLALGMESCGMVYDSRRKVMVLSGFNEGPHVFELRQNLWVEVEAEGNPGLRTGYGLTYNPDRGRALLVGSSHWGGSDSALFEFDGISWTGIEPALSPDIGTEFLRTVYDPRRRAVIYAGGIGHAPGEVWEFSFWSAHPDENCTDGADNDGDVLIDCDDLDCAHHPDCL